MDKPIIKLINYNEKLPNPQEFKFLGGLISEGRLIWRAVVDKANGWTGKGPYMWIVETEYFKQGEQKDKDETFDFKSVPFTHKIDDSKKNGGKFVPAEKTVFYYTVSRMFEKGTVSKSFTFKFKWTLKVGIISVDEVLPPEEVDCNALQILYNDLLIKYEKLRATKPKPKKFSKTPFIGFSAKSKIIILLQSALFWKKWKLIKSHAFAGFLEDKECLSAEWRGVVRINLEKILDNARTYELYLLPVKNEDQINQGQVFLNKTEGAKYNRYKHFLWALNVGVVFAIIGLIPAFIFGIIKPYLITMAILYLPIRLFLKHKSKGTYDCIHEASGFSSKFGVDFLNGEKTNSLSPDASCEKVQFSNSLPDGKRLKLYKKK